MRKTGDKYPCGPCELPLECSGCGLILTEDNLDYDRCEGDCELCDYCSTAKCPECGWHKCCGGCV